MGLVRGIIAALVLLGLAAGAHAQALVLYGGVSHESDQHGRAYPWALEYTEGIARPVDLGVMYLNQGHFAGHHRDGIAAELLLHTPRASSGWTFGAGVGPFYYFDTTGTGADYRNQHGTGVIYTATADWQLHRRWFMSVRAQHVDARKSFDTSSVLVGLGYRWQAALLDEERAEGIAPLPPNELDVFVGRTVVNSFSSEHSVATSVEYRRSLRRWLDWTGTWLNEGDARLIRRNGIATQLWLVRHAHDDRVELGAGLGPYLAVDRYRHANGQSQEALSGLVSLTARYNVVPNWNLRATWHRVLANYQRDTDVFLVGLGYGF